jgi:hypothetical protein
MPQYQVPKLYANGQEILFIKSLTWKECCNEIGSFELTAPIEGNPDVWSTNVIFTMSNSTTRMWSEVVSKSCDTKGNIWIKIKGRDRKAQDTWRACKIDGVINLLSGSIECKYDDKMYDLYFRIAKNTNRFFNYAWNGSQDILISKTVGAATAIIDKEDITESELYADNLGGYTDFCRVKGKPKPTINKVIKSGTVTHSGSLPSYQRSGANLYFFTESGASYNFEYVYSWIDNELSETDNEPLIFAGGGTRDGSLQEVSADIPWVTSDVTHEYLNYKLFDYHTTARLNNESSGNIVNVSVWWNVPYRYNARTITLKSDAAYQAEMQALLKYATVIGGANSYSCTLKSKGNVNKRYKVDYNLGDTITINDTRLDVLYTAVVSGATETIDSSGYSVAIELGTVGATLQQRLARNV